MTPVLLNTVLMGLYLPKMCAFCCADGSNMNYVCNFIYVTNCKRKTVILCSASFSSLHELLLPSLCTIRNFVRAHLCMRLTATLSSCEQWELQTLARIQTRDHVPSQDGRTWGWARVPGSSSPLLSTHQHCWVTGWHWMGSKLPSSSLHFGRYNCLAGIPVSWALCSSMARMCWHAETQHSSVTYCMYDSVVLIRQPVPPVHSVPQL
jgi:hypothetical protein